MSNHKPMRRQATQPYVCLAALGLLGSGHSGAVLAQSHIFATEVREVRSSSVDGHNLLTLEISRTAGPNACRGTTLLVQRTQDYPTVPEADFEALALHAMLSSEALVLSVPTDFRSCIDGKPTITDMWLKSYE